LIIKRGHPLFPVTNAGANRGRYAH